MQHEFILTLMPTMIPNLHFIYGPSAQSATLSPLVSLLGARCLPAGGVFRVVAGQHAEAAPVSVVVATAVGVCQACTR